MSTNLLIRVLLGFSLYITIWSYAPGTERIIQISSVIGVFIAGCLSLLKTPRFNGFSYVEIFFIIVLMTSTVTSLLTNNNYSFQYTIVFGVYCVSAALISRVLSETEILDVFVITLIAIILTVLITQFGELKTALSIKMTVYDGLQRFTPLGMHPNLTGMVYGGATVCLGFKALYTCSNYKRIFYAVAAFIAFMFIIAASARSSLLALMVPAVFFLITYMKNLNKTRATYLFIIAIVIIVLLSMRIDTIINYLAEILEFNSSTRGIDSGGTGRFELWAMGIETLKNDTSRLLFGYGLRSSEANIIGFSLESSYLTLLFDLGFVLTLGYLILVCLAVFISFKNSKVRNEFGTGPHFNIAMLFVFLICQSFFNRYLVSIGNFYSAFFLLLLFSVIRNNKLLLRF